MPIVLLAFVHETVWVYVLSTVFIPFLIPNQAFLSAFVVPVPAKAWFEIAVMSVFTSAIAGNSGLTAFLGRYLHTTRSLLDRFGKGERSEISTSSRVTGFLKLPMRVNL